jgi:hypothetical protein
MNPSSFYNDALTLIRRQFDLNPHWELTNAERSPPPPPQLLLIFSGGGAWKHFLYDDFITITLHCWGDRAYWIYEIFSALELKRSTCCLQLLFARVKYIKGGICELSHRRKFKRMPIRGDSVIAQLEWHPISRLPPVIWDILFEKSSSPFLCAIKI